MMMLDRVTTLDAIYNAENGPIFMTGIQALVRCGTEQGRP
jgi:indolepyruvate ferredoxin oxidoreductase